MDVNCWVSVMKEDNGVGVIQLSYLGTILI